MRRAGWVGSCREQWGIFLGKGGWGRATHPPLVCSTASWQSFMSTSNFLFTHIHLFSSCYPLVATDPGEHPIQLASWSGSRLTLSRLLFPTAVPSSTR
jgi:hypothetical protein